MINDYALWTDKVWKSGSTSQDMDERDLSIVSLGLAGETGEALEYVKKFLRDGKDPRQGERKEEFKKELGDIIYYWARLVSWAGMTPEEVLYANMEKLEKRHAKRILEGKAA